MDPVPKVGFSGTPGFSQKIWQKNEEKSCSQYLCLGPNSPGPLTDDWKVTDDSSINFHDMFFFIFCYNLAKNEEKHVMEIYR